MAKYPRLFSLLIFFSALGSTGRAANELERADSCEDIARDPQALLDLRLQKWRHAAPPNALLPQAHRRILKKLNDPILELPVGDLIFFRTYLYNGNAKVSDLERALEAINLLFEKGRLTDSALKKRHPELGSIGEMIFNDMQLWADLVPRKLIARTLKNLLTYELGSVRKYGDADDLSKLASNYLGVFLNYVRLYGDDKKFIDRAADLIPISRGALRFSAFFAELPKSWQKQMRRYWLSEDFSSAPQLRGLRLIDEDTQEELEECGTCPDMDHGHIEGHDSHLVYLGGVLLGSLKLWGDPSMIALNDVADDKGRLVVARGMVYGVSKKIVARATTDRAGFIKLRRGSDFPVHPKISILAPGCKDLGGECFRDFIRQLRQKRCGASLL